ncbi:MAG: pyridoxamine 5'-phosphate oxidase family protein [Candidatus Omnitrophota bacterium]|jgi:uncharacterized pyridoxamine 5'-phosphate oxidase family protein
MKKLGEEIILFFRNQRFVIVSTIDANGVPHTSCKGIVKIDEKGWVYLLDLYSGNTFANLRRNSNISLTSVDEHAFLGYCLKGRAKIVPVRKLKQDIVSLWEETINSRISHRIVKNLRGEKGHSRHPEALLPDPEYVIVVKIKESVDLTPRHLKE